MEELKRINKDMESVRTEVGGKQEGRPEFTSVLNELPRSPLVSLTDSNVR